jgi:hypothetical protein
VTDSLPDLDAYEQLDISFILKPSLQNEEYINVASFLDIKKIVEQRLETKSEK